MSFFGRLTRKLFFSALFIFVTFGVSACLMALFTSPVHAATASVPPFNLTTSPLPVALTTTPGKPITTKLRFQNSGTSPVNLKVSLLKFKASGTTGQPLLLKRAPGDDYFDWVSFSQTALTAEPGVWNEITMTIRPPQTAAFGYYYAVVFSQDVPNALPTTPNTGKINGATATLILLNVQAPGEKKQLDVVSFASDKKLYEYLPATFTITVHNSGNIHAIPFGSIFISRDHKHDIAVLNVNTAEGNILPNSNRAFAVSWDDGFPAFTVKRDHGQIISDQHGKPLQQLQWNFAKTDKLRFGHYFAHLLLTYDNGVRDVPMEADVSFWVIPWKVLPLLAIVFIVIGIGLWSTGRFVIKRIRKRNGKSDKTFRRK